MCIYKSMYTCVSMNVRTKPRFNPMLSHTKETISGTSYLLA